MHTKIKTAIIGPGNIGLDLMFKIMKRGENIELDTLASIRETSKGLATAREHGFNTSGKGIEDILKNDEIKIVFDCTNAKAHKEYAPLLKKHGKIAIDLTPAAVGPYVVPAVNMQGNYDTENINLITCGGQATIPIVAAISSVAPVEYAEIVATISSRSAGPGTRQSIDEFTQTTANGVVKVGGAKKGKAIIILNPAEPPIMMRNTIYCRVEKPDLEAITKSVEDMVEKIKEYVPGYRLKLAPIIDGNKVTTMIEVEGEGLHLPKYSGNLDIINAAALAIAERIAGKLLKTA